MNHSARVAIEWFLSTSGGVSGSSSLGKESSVAIGISASSAGSSASDSALRRASTNMCWLRLLVVFVSSEFVRFLDFFLGETSIIWIARLFFVLTKTSA